MSVAVKATKAPKAPKAPRTKKGAKNEVVAEIEPDPVLSTTDNDNINTIENDIKDMPVDTVMSEETAPVFDSDEDDETEELRLMYEASLKRKQEKQKKNALAEYKKDCKKDVEIYIDRQKAKLKAFCEKNDIEEMMMCSHEDEILRFLYDDSLSHCESFKITLNTIQEKLFNEKNPAKPAKAEKAEKANADGKVKRKPAIDKNRPSTAEDYKKIFQRDTMIHHHRKMNAYGIFIHDEGVFYECDEDGQNRGQSFKLMNHFTQHNIKKRIEETGIVRTLQNGAYVECNYLSDEGVWLTCDNMNRDAQLTQN